MSGIYPKLGRIINGIVRPRSRSPAEPRGSVFDRLVCRALELVALIGSNNTTQNLGRRWANLSDLSLVDVLNGARASDDGPDSDLARHDERGRSCV